MDFMILHLINQIARFIPRKDQKGGEVKEKKRNKRNLKKNITACTEVADLNAP